MIRRCADATRKDWHLYGGKTPPVTVCERWLKSYDDFAADMGPKPTPKHSLDRIDSMEGYRPDNCRWATPIEQARNAATNRRISFDGHTCTLAEWADLTGLKYLTVFMRLKRGWPVEKALTVGVLPLGSFDIIRDPVTGRILGTKSKVRE